MNTQRRSNNAVVPGGGRKGIGRLALATALALSWFAQAAPASRVEAAASVPV